MEQRGDPRLTKRQITLKDGRYLIFYTFVDEPTRSPGNTKAERSEPKPQRKGKRRV